MLNSYAPMYAKASVSYRNVTLLKFKSLKCLQSKPSNSSLRPVGWLMLPRPVWLNPVPLGQLH